MAHSNGRVMRLSHSMDLLIVHLLPDTGLFSKLFKPFLSVLASLRCISIPFSGEVPSSQDYAFLIQAQNLTSCPGSCIRPAGLAFGRDVKLYATSDSSGEVSRFLLGSFCHLTSYYLSFLSWSVPKVEAGMLCIWDSVAGPFPNTLRVGQPNAMR